MEKKPFTKTCDTILEIIKESEDPILTKDIHSKLIERTGTKSSHSTVVKCLKRLVSIHEIEREEICGKGNPVVYSFTNRAPFSIFNKQIDESREILIENDMVSKGDYVSTAQLINFDVSFTILIRELLKALGEYSNSENRRNAEIEFKQFTEAVFVPALNDITKLVKPPLNMTTKLSLLLARCYVDFDFHLSFYANELQTDKYELSCNYKDFLRFAGDNLSPEIREKLDEVV
ncbi:hypothetical protein [Methanococcoides sp. AM1]|uniref:hypothetical protein n=1 Tax=Methanococcoides sp. AM1 TaxID=1201011 RepID=UPI0010827EB9|nr:hypothetical protein [Methanococcoides sp. AM1]